MDSIASLSELQPTSKDCKALIPTLIDLFGNMNTKIEQMFSVFKSELLNKLAEKDEQIAELRSDVNFLKNRVIKLEDQLDDNDAYERKDTLIFSGASVPIVKEDEDCGLVLRNTVKDKLKFVLCNDAISVCHRLGSKPTIKNPIIDRSL